MNIDITSFFFNSTIEGKTATAAWGTSIGQSITRKCKIEMNKPGVSDLIAGMIYKSISNKDKFDLSRGSSSRDYLLCSIFDKIYVNGIYLEGQSFIVLLSRENSCSHKGRLTISYPPYAKYSDGLLDIDNEKTIAAIRDAIGCSVNGCWFAYAISVINQDELHFNCIVVDKNNPKVYIGRSQDRSYEWASLIPEADVSMTILRSMQPVQKIYFGAPGTGKSFRIQEDIGETINKATITFHPDSDYSSFVGSYKPFKEGDTITYKFIPQAFAKAYIAAWKILLNGLQEPYYLVIEEINRGNCAQILGDVFQLLDRGESGFSDYVIDVDEDFAQYLKEELGEYPDYRETIIKLISPTATAADFKYSKIALPRNLSILASMNTSDQSLFPMDSAFKRRWDWEYVPINSSSVSYAKIKIGENEYSWSSFIDNINEKIMNTCKSEDKQLGAFFIKVSKEKPEIDWKLFRSKVMSFLWFDVYKDLYESDENIVFRYYKDDKKEESVEFSFGMLFNGEENEQITLLQKFMEYINEE